MKKKYYLIGFLLLFTAITLTNLWEMGMMGLTGFCLAYLTKGMRKRSGFGVSGDEEFFPKN